MADAQVSKTCEGNTSWRFDSSHRHNMVELTGRVGFTETIFGNLADYVQRYHRAVASGNLKFVEIHSSLVEDLYWIASDAGIPAIESAKVFVASSPVQSRKKVLAVLTSKHMLSQRDARRIDKEFGITTSLSSSPVRRT